MSQRDLSHPLRTASLQMLHHASLAFWPVPFMACYQRRWPAEHLPCAVRRGSASIGDIALEKKKAFFTFHKAQSTSREHECTRRHTHLQVSSFSTSFTITTALSASASNWHFARLFVCPSRLQWPNLSRRLLRETTPRAEAEVNDIHSSPLMHQHSYFTTKAIRLARHDLPLGSPC